MSDSGVVTVGCGRGPGERTSGRSVQHGDVRVYSELKEWPLRSGRMKLNECYSRGEGLVVGGSFQGVRKVFLGMIISH